MIPIIGMHRSGTSALAGALHRLGVDLGPESSWLSAATDNPRGFFEFQPVVDLNRAVLVAFDGTWSTPPALPAGWIDDDRIADHRRSAERLLGEMPSKMVVKDPRLSLTQPLWDSIERPGPSILCVRHPRAVAESLHARNSFDLDQAMYLWLRYNAAAVVNRPDALVVHYERLIDDPSSVLSVIVGALRLEASDVSIELAARSIETSMSHHDGARLPDTAVGRICEAFYDDLLTERPGGSAPEPTDWMRLLTELPVAGSSDKEIATLRRTNQEGSEELMESRQEVERLRDRIDRLENELNRVNSLTDMQTIRGILNRMNATTPTGTT